MNIHKVASQQGESETWLEERLSQIGFKKYTSNGGYIDVAYIRRSGFIGLLRVFLFGEEASLSGDYQNLYLKGNEFSDQECDKIRAVFEDYHRIHGKNQQKQQPKEQNDKPIKEIGYSD